MSQPKEQAILGALEDCQVVMDAAANDLSNPDYIMDGTLQRLAEQLAEYAMNARTAIAKHN